MALDEASQALMKQLASTPDAKPLHEMTPAEARAMGAAKRANLAFREASRPSSVYCVE